MLLEMVNKDGHIEDRSFRRRSACWRPLMCSEVSLKLSHGVHWQKHQWWQWWFWRVMEKYGTSCR